MDRTYRKRKTYQIFLAVTLLAVLLTAQYDSLVHVSNRIMDCVPPAADESSLDPSLRTWIYEDNGAGDVLFFYERPNTGRVPGMSGHALSQERSALTEPHFMELLLLLLLTAFWGAKRQFILALDRASAPRRSGCLVLRFQHRLDGEKDRSYSFS